VGLPVVASEIAAHRAYPVETASDVPGLCRLIARHAERWCAGTVHRRAMILPGADLLAVLADKIALDLDRDLAEHWIERCSRRLEFDVLGWKCRPRKLPSAAGPGVSKRRMMPVNAPRRANDVGFTLIEMTLVLAIISLIAALSLPRVSLSGSTASLRIKGFEIAAILRADRDEAVRSGRPVSSLIDAVGGRMRSGAANGEVVVPANLVLQVSGAAQDAIRFLPDGSASGGEIFLMRTNRSGLLAVRVNPLTAAVEIDRGAIRAE
jgi:general secretion pathway protein H